LKVLGICRGVIHIHTPRFIQGWGPAYAGTPEGQGQGQGLSFEGEHPRSEQATRPLSMRNLGSLVRKLVD